MKRILPIFILMLIAGCTRWQLTVDDYMRTAHQIDLGMSKSEVVQILSPSQRRLRNTEIKQPDRYIKDGVNVEILYFRSGWQSDGLTTDDEFTPYLFNDGKLVAIGWTTLGGPKSQGQARSSTYVNQSSTTIVY